MSKGYVATVDRLTAIIRDITPTYDADLTFVCVEDGDGVVNDLSHPGMPSRAFDLRLEGLPTDAGYTGPNGFVLRSILLLRVKYRTDVDRGRAERMIGSDVHLITTTLLDCCLWDSDNTGINTIVPPDLGAVTLEPLDDEQPAVVLSLPIEVEYLEGV